MAWKDEPLDLAPKVWDELDARGKRRVEMLLSSLSEIEAGWQHSKQVQASGEKLGHDQNHPLFRFMANSLSHYTCGTFMGSTAGAQSVLRDLDLGPVADELDALLAKPVGQHSLKTFLEEQRNTTVAHPTFDPMHMLKRVFDQASLEDPVILKQYRESLTEFMDTTKIVHVLLRKLYPIAAASEDSRWKADGAGRGPR